MTIAKGISHSTASVAAVAVLCALVFIASPAHAATITTDKADYAPGETATIYGSLFDALQNVVLSIVGQASDGSTQATASWDVTADDAGAFTTQYTLPDTFIPLYLVAADSTDGSVLAETSFTDANNPKLSLTMNGTGAGHVDNSGTTTCSSNCTWVYSSNNPSVTLTAVASGGSTFAGWSGACTGTGTCSPTGLTGNSTVNVTATFNLIPVVQNQTITVDTAAPGSATYGSSFGVAAHSSSGLPVAVTTTGGCSGSGSGSATITMTSGITACTVHYNQAGNASYNPAPEVTSNTTANKASPNCSVTGYSVTYDTASHTASGSCAGVNSEGPLAGLDLSGTTHTDAGTYNGDAWSYPGTANYSSASGTVDDSIAKAPAGCSISGYSGTYDGSPHGATGSCTGVGTDGTLSGLDRGDSFTDVPGGIANWSFSNSNYVSQNGSVSIDISKAPSATVVTFEAGPYVYRGTAFTATANVTGAGGLNVPVTPVNYSGDCTNVTSTNGCTAAATYGGDTNHDGSTDSESITITQVPSTVSVDCTLGSPFTYTGLAQTPCTAIASGVGMTDVDVSSSIVYGNNTNVGAATANASWDGDANHTGNTGSGGFTIGQAVLTVTASSASILQGAAIPPITPGYSGFVNSETAGVLDIAPTCSASVADSLTAGDFATNCTGGSDNNYSFSFVAGTLHIYSLDSVFHGLFNPLTTTLKNFQKNSTIPVKFALNGGTGNFFGGDATLQICEEGGSCTAAVASGGSNVGSTFRYDSSAGQYIYNLSTKNSFFRTGHTYDFTITINSINKTAVQKAMIKLGK